MPLTIHVYHHYEDGRLDTIEALLQQLITQGESTMADLNRLTLEVQENNDAVQSAITLLGSLADMLRDAATDPSAIEALANQLDIQSGQLAAAVVANTPAQPEPPDVPGDGEPTETPSVPAPGEPGPV